MFSKKITIGLLSLCLIGTSVPSEAKLSNKIIAGVAVAGTVYALHNKHPELIKEVSAATVSMINDLIKKLSNNKDEFNEYFYNDPNKREEVARYLYENMGIEKDKNRYNKLEKIALELGLPNIPRYSSGAKPYLPNVLETPIQPQNPKDNLLANYINANKKTNIIVTPQGKAFDPSTEFPNEQINNWNDFLIIQSHSVELSDNMIASGIKREDGVAAHHILPATHPLAQAARNILEKYSNVLGKNAFNNEINGAFLPRDNSSKQSGIIHNGTHPYEYVRKINDIVVNADAKGGLPEIIKEL